MTASQGLLDGVLGAVQTAGGILLQMREGPLDPSVKADGSPVCRADLVAQAFLVQALAGIAPDLPIIAEEGTLLAVQCGKPAFWLVDPLDGTKEFLRGSPEFTVNVALVRQGRPVLGVIQAPALGAMYAGMEGRAFVERAGARRPLACRCAPPEGMTVVASRSHGEEATLDAYLRRLPVHRRKNAGSSLKFCLVAAGEADLYPRFGTTMEWDTAAGDAILHAAGGSVVDVEGRALRYGKTGYRNPHFVASGLEGPHGGAGSSST